ncbi:MFS transporter [Tepidanaerobacter syntrophicus]|uniref:MFS transporter n=1 Tax=Tepidanaerobacter syntrophicus TaxID=224999 RepID=UPI0022EEA08C|nr:MFS transporter [Tepidanaerobacter syntrophicus]GLI19904.1 MFS transporter [Tepidanaerobacter syntrophicus]
MWLEKGIGQDKRWFYPISAFLIGASITVTEFWTMFYPHVQGYFGLDTAASVVLAATFSGMGVMTIGPPLAGIILDKYGPKINFLISASSLVLGHSLIIKMLSLQDWSMAMYFWYLGSFFVGLGCGFFGGTSPATIGKWFPDKAGTALGLAVAGGSCAAMIYPPLVASFIKTNGFTGKIFLSFAMIAVIFLIGLGVLFWKTPPHDWMPASLKKKSDTLSAKPANLTKDYTFQEAIRNKMFWLLCTCFICAAFSSMLFVQNASLIILEGLSSTMSKEDILTSVIPSFVSMSAIGALAGRFGWGVITDKLGGPWKTLWIVYLLPAILIGVFYLSYHSKMLIFVIGFLLYFCNGGAPVVHYAIVPHVFGRRHLGKIMNTLNAISVGVGMALGPYIGAYIKDATGGYYWALITAIIIRLCGTVLARIGLRLANK